MLIESPLILTSPIFIGIIALIFALILYGRIKKQPTGNEIMNRISSYIREGAMTFLRREYQVLSIYALIAFFLISLLMKSWLAGGSFLLGAALSLLAGFLGMKAATYANVCTTQAARQNNKGAAMLNALDGGAVMGLSVAGLGLFGLGCVYFIFRQSPQLSTLLHSFAVGASSIALFARIGGGIYTKAADVGADIAGKVVKGLPEDDPRNPGVIADNVGDNVGDVAGMGADIYESMVAAIVAAMALAYTLPIEKLHALVSTPSHFTEESLRFKGVLIPILLSALGLVISFVVIAGARAFSAHNPARILRWSLALPPLLLTLLLIFLTPLLGVSQQVTVCLGCGAFAGTLIGMITDYYTSSKPVHQVAKANISGAATGIIRGLATGMESIALPMLIVAATAFVANMSLGLYGIALAAVGMLAGTAVVMTVDAYGPIADNAGGISEMSALGPETRAITDELDAVGNTTAAIGKGFAIGSAILTVLSLFSAVSMEAAHRHHAMGDGGNLGTGGATGVGAEMGALLSLTEAPVLIGLLLGSILPFLVGSSTMKAVGVAGAKIVEEIRRQFNEIPGLMEGKAEPEPKAIVDIATRAALWQMIFPGLVAILSPPLIGFTLGIQALCGMLAGALAVGSTMAFFMANAGGTWDNAKKYIEKGGLHGHPKGSETHKSAVIGDTVGDPFKDTSGPGISILIKVMGVVSLLIAPLL